jgi:hypothetical protein
MRWINGKASSENFKVCCLVTGLVLLPVLLVICTSACGLSWKESDQAKPTKASIRFIEDKVIPGWTSHLVVIRDDERHVTCYAIMGDGISCVPDLPAVLSPPPATSPSGESCSLPPTP